MKNHLKQLAFLTTCLAIVALFAASGLARADELALSPLELLGEFLYFDVDLSSPDGQSCASCHHPDSAFVDPDTELPVSEGVLPHRFGGRNAPSAASVPTVGCA